MKALSFEGNGLEYFKIWIVNILLTIVTLGIYYPWAKVRNKRYFYANSTLENRNFEYHATGKQLLVGYLIAVGLLILYVGIQSISPTGGVIVLLIFFAGYPWIIWRSLKFNLAMTSFSNVRFSFDNKLGGAYINYMLLPIACFIAFYAPFIIIAIVFSMGQPSSAVLGGIIGLVLVIAIFALAIFLFAFMKKRNTHYSINGYRYGQGHFLTEVQTKPFAMIILKTMGLSFLALIGFMLFAGVIAYITVGLEQLMQLQLNMQNPETMQDPEAFTSIFLIVGFIYLGFILVSFVVLAYSYTRQRAYILANSVLDEKITFASTLKTWPMAWVMISNLIAIIFTLGLAYAWAKVRMARLILENTQVDTSVGFDGYISQKQQEQSSLGDQIGDAFDVDVGIGF